MSTRRSSVREDPLDGVKRMLHDRLLSRMDARQLGAAKPSERRLRVREEALAILREERHILPSEALSRVVNEVSDRVVGLGAIEPLLRDPEVSEGILITGCILAVGCLPAPRRPA